MLRIAENVQRSTRLRKATAWQALNLQRRTQKQRAEIER
jgi:hypothetical protein